MRFSLITFFPLAFGLLAAAAPLNKRASFTQDNGDKAIAQNSANAELTADSPCTTGQNACIDGKFAQCDGGKFALSECGPGTVCKVLPLVNSAGTSVTCDTAGDADQRIQNTGATKRSFLKERASFTKDNGDKAIDQNAANAELTADSPCTAGQNACIDGKFAQCSGGKFLLSPCGTGTVCKVLPLVNSAGTSVTCDTAGDAEQRIQNTGANKRTTRADRFDAIHKRSQQTDRDIKTTDTKRSDRSDKFVAIHKRRTTAQADRDIKSTGTKRSDRSARFVAINKRSKRRDMAQATRDVENTGVKRTDRSDKFVAIHRRQS